MSPMNPQRSVTKIMGNKPSPPTGGGGVMALIFCVNVLTPFFSFEQIRRSRYPCFVRVVSRPAFSSLRPPQCIVSSSAFGFVDPESFRISFDESSPDHHHHEIKLPRA